MRLSAGIGARKLLVEVATPHRIEMSHIDAQLAQEFPLDPGILYLNHAAVAPWPKRTAETVKRFADENLKQGARNYDRWLQTELNLRKRLAAMINAPSSNDIALLKNTSEALSIVAHGFPWHEGDNVVISDEEFPSNRIVWESLGPLGVSVRQVKLKGSKDPEQAIMDAADMNTRLVSISSVQYASGLRLDLLKLGRLCRERQIVYCVDAIQSLGAITQDVQAANIDFLMADAHKWLLGPEAIAVFYCHEEWRDRLTLHEYGWHMVQDHMDFDRKEWKPALSARRFECGSPNMLGIHALDASLSLFEEIGMKEIETRILRRSDWLFELIAKQPDLELITDPTPGRYAGIVTFRHRSTPVAESYQHLRKHNVVCAMRGGGIRYSPHCYTTPETLHKATQLSAI